MQARGVAPKLTCDEPSSLLPPPASHSARGGRREGLPDRRARGTARQPTGETDVPHASFRQDTQRSKSNAPPRRRLLAKRSRGAWGAGAAGPKQGGWVGGWFQARPWLPGKGSPWRGAHKGEHAVPRQSRVDCSKPSPLCARADMEHGWMVCVAKIRTYRIHTR